ncbi:MAG: hypothetical protein GY847_24150 [Proteobacteria bacterium]|nr:hypothetical protein [Pseudomonadota bacterium]
MEAIVVVEADPYINLACCERREIQLHMLAGGGDASGILSSHGVARASVDADLDFDLPCSTRVDAD